MIDAARLTRHKTSLTFVLQYSSPVDWHWQRGRAAVIDSIDYLLRTFRHHSWVADHEAVKRPHYLFIYLFISGQYQESNKSIGAFSIY